jgi:uncharacterized protein YjbJ (UPF0337 family)
MGEGTFDNVKGKVKEAAGDLTDDKDMKREGKTDQAAGNVKDKIGNVKETAEDAVDKVKDKLHKD